MRIAQKLPHALLAGLAVTLFGAIEPGSARADIFSYVDKDGIVHFSTNKSDARFSLYVKSSSKRTKDNKFTGKAVPPSDKSLDRFTRYDKWIHQAATLYQLPEEFVRAIIKVESDYDPRAVSSAGAIGLMQLMPETATRMQVRDPYDPRENIFGGCRYLRVLANLFNGDLDLTIAAYNAGEGAVERAGGIPDYPETQDYVVKVRTYYASYRQNRDVVTASSQGLPFRPDL